MLTRAPLPGTTAPSRFRTPMTRPTRSAPPCPRGRERPLRVKPGVWSPTRALTHAGVDLRRSEHGACSVNVQTRAWNHGFAWYGHVLTLGVMPLAHLRLGTLPHAPAASTAPT